jgi:hypothetical protein
MARVPFSDEEILAAYQRHGSVHTAGAALGISHSVVHRRIQKMLGDDRRYAILPASAVERIRRDYRAYVDAGRLDELAAELGRTKQFICRKASEMGLTDAQQARVRAAAKCKELTSGKPKWVDKPHPRGFLGGKHSEEARAAMGQKSTDFWQHLSADDRSEFTLRQLRAKVAKYGTPAPAVKRGSWKAAWREIGGKRKFFRSRWEANYARLLQWLKERGEILEWEHEAETFWFEAIKRGVRSYLPDFRVTELDGSQNLHEVKGWMDARSKTTLKRMAKYHPDQKITLIDGKAYASLAKRFSRLIEGWE